MKTPKHFDCVQMKNDIQEKLQARRGGMTEAQRMADTDRQLDSSDSPMAKLWRDIRPVAVPRTRNAATSVRR